MFNSHPGCICPQSFEGPHCENLSGEMAKSEVSNDSGSDGNDGNRRMSTAAIVALVVILDLLVLGVVGLVVLRRWQREHAIDAEYGARLPQNLMAHGNQEPPTFENILSVNRMPDESERSEMSRSHNSGRSYFKDEEDDGSRDDGDESSDLENVQII